MRRTLAVMLATFGLTFAVPAAVAQPTGTLMPKTLSTEAERFGARVVSSESMMRIYGQNLSVEEQKEVALIAANPYGSSTARASNWFVSFSGISKASEAHLQINVCDAVPKSCDSLHTAFDLGLIGPVSKSDDFTELADLYGLYGTTRVEGGVTFRPAELKKVVGSVRASWWPTSTFDFRTPGNLAKASERHGQYSVSGEVGYRRKLKTREHSLTWFAGVSGRLEDSFKDDTSKFVCDAPVSSTGASACTQDPVGAPLESRKRVATPEFRIALTDVWAASVSYSYDFKTHAAGWDIPIWAAYNGESGTGGGIRFGYKRGDKHATATLFVSAFTL